MAANLAQFDPRWGFTMKMVQWKQVLEVGGATIKKILPYRPGFKNQLMFPDVTV